MISLLFFIPVSFADRYRSRSGEISSRPWGNPWPWVGR